MLTRHHALHKELGNNRAGIIIPTSRLNEQSDNDGFKLTERLYDMVKIWHNERQEVSRQLCKV